MGTNPSKAADNVYSQARLKAAIHNDKLKSREGASECLGISPSSLADYELGITKIVPVDKVVLMADLYGAPELLNDYCTTACPIGCRTVEKLEVVDIDRLTLRTLSAFSQAQGVPQSLIDIMEDGVVSEEERPQLEEVLMILNNIAIRTEELKLWVRKNLD